MDCADTSYDKVIPKVIQTIRASSSLAAQDVRFHTSLDPTLMVDLESTSKSLLSIVNKMMSEISPDYYTSAYGESEVKSLAAWKNISNTLDICFEKVDIALDTIKNSGRGEKSMAYLLESYDEGAPPEVIEKPQNQFRIKIDNSDTSPFKPKLTRKPHALQPLEESIKYVNEGTAPEDRHYSHPYELEIMKQPFPETHLVQRNPILPTDWDSTSSIWIDKVEDLQKMVDELLLLKEIAVDLEHHDYRSYYGITCLMQISNREKDWLIDTLALRDDLQVLNEVLTNLSIVKVFHGASMDIIWLQRDLGLYVVSLFDTYHASKKLGFPKFSLAYLLESIAHFKTSKKYQLADWRVRPLTSMMSQYARADTHFLLYIYDVLRNKLIEREVLQDVLYESRRVACRKFEYNKFRNDCNEWLRSNIGTPSLNWLLSQYNLPASKKNLLDSLLIWRDSLARYNDESPRYIMSNQSIINLCSVSSPVDNEKIKFAIGKCSDHVDGAIDQLFNIITENLTSFTQTSDEERPSELLHEIVDYLTAREVSELFFGFTKPEIEKDILLVVTDSTCLTSLYLESESMCFSVNFRSGTRITTRDESRKRLNFLKQNFDIGLHESSTVAWQASEAHDQNDNIPNPSVNESEDISTQIEDALSQIFTLSKKNVKRHRIVKEEIAGDPIFDYNSPENVNVLGAVAMEPRAKKRSFDPFSKAGYGGPKAAKRSKNVATGKSASFKNRNKRK